MKKITLTFSLIIGLSGCSSTPIRYDPPQYDNNAVAPLQKVDKLIKLGQRQEADNKLKQLMSELNTNALLYTQEHYSYKDNESSKAYSKTGCYIEFTNGRFMAQYSGSNFRKLLGKGLRPYYLSWNMCKIMQFSGNKDYLSLYSAFEPANEDPMTNAMDLLSSVYYKRSRNYQSVYDYPLLSSEEKSFNELNRLVKDSRFNYGKLSLPTELDELVDSIIKFKSTNGIGGTIAAHDLYTHNMCLGDGLPENKGECVTNQILIIKRLTEYISVNNALAVSPLALYYKRGGLKENLAELESMVAKLDTLDGIYDSKLLRNVKAFVKTKISEYKAI